MEYKYKIFYNLCLLAALLLIYHSINTAFGDGLSGKRQTLQYISAYSLL